jgi:hypothetical protein
MSFWMYGRMWVRNLDESLPEISQDWHAHEDVSSSWFINYSAYDMNADIKA